MTIQAVRPVILTIEPKIPTLGDIIKGTVPPVSGGTSTTLSIPSWVRNGDFMVMFRAMTRDPQVPSRYDPYPNEWISSWTTQVGYGWAGSTEPFGYLLGGSTRGATIGASYRVANNEPSSYNIDWHMEGYAPELYEGEVNLVQILFLVVFNGDLIKGIDDVNIIPYGRTTANRPIWEPAASSISMSGWSLQEDNEPFFAAFVTNEAEDISFTAPSGMTELCNASAGSGVQSMTMKVGMKIGSGSTGALSASFAAATYGAACAGGYIR